MTPTPDQLVAFFRALTQLRSVFGEVAIRFAGNNPLPVVLAAWTDADPMQRVEADSDSVDDLTAAMVQLYETSQAEAAMRQEYTTIMNRAKEIRTQLGIR